MSELDECLPTNKILIWVAFELNILVMSQPLYQKHLLDVVLFLYKGNFITLCGLFIILFQVMRVVMFLKFAWP